SGADIESICHRAALLALREWITPRLNIGRVQISETSEESTETQTQTSQPSPSGALSNENGAITAQYQIRMDHFARALNEQRERYQSFETNAEAQKKQEEGRQRLLEIAADYGPGKQKQLKGFRLWLARLFGLA